MPAKAHERVVNHLERNGFPKQKKTIRALLVAQDELYDEDPTTSEERQYGRPDAWGFDPRTNKLTWIEVINTNPLKHGKLFSVAHWLVLMEEIFHIEAEILVYNTNGRLVEYFHSWALDHFAVWYDLDRAQAIEYRQHFAAETPKVQLNLQGTPL